MNELKIYLKSGHTLDIVCESYMFKFNHVDGEFVGYEIKGFTNVSAFSIEPSQIAAFTVVKKEVESE